MSNPTSCGPKVVETSADTYERPEGAVFDSTPSNQDPVDIPDGCAECDSAAAGIRPDHGREAGDAGRAASRNSEGDDASPGNTARCGRAVRMDHLQ